MSMDDPARRLRTVNPPVERGSTVLLPDAAALYDHSRPTYGRQGLSTQAALAGALAELEGATQVHLFPSGLAAVAGAVLSVVSAGDTVLAADCVYAPVRRFLSETLKRFGAEVTYFDPALSPDAVLAMADERTRLIVMESPGSLTFDVQDAPGIAAAARARGILTLMDNTWAAGVLFKPLAAGVDLSVQALTKYVAGHADVFAGSVATADRRIGAQVEQAIHDMGWALSPDDAYLVLRGMRTLELRLERHGASALAVASWLQSRPEVTQVLCPALPGAPGHELWRRDYSGGNGLFGVVLTPGSRRAVNRLLDTLTCFGLGFSWGGFESLAIAADPQMKRRADHGALGGPLLRLHIGLEPVERLTADLARGLDAYAAASREDDR
jgi:cystathionine beta-lyase